MMKAVPRSVRMGGATGAVFAVLWLHLATAAVGAAPLTDYHARVREALVAADALALAESEEEMKAGTFDEMRTLLPPTERIEWRGTTVVVNNEWLHRALDDYQKTAARLSAEERTAALTRIAERLHALEARLAQAEGAPQEARDKDAEKGRLATILRRDEYNRKASEGGALRRLIQQIFEWIRDLFPDVKPIRPGAGRPSTALQIVVFTLALALIAFIVWKFWVRRRDRLKPSALKEPRVVLGERIAPEQTASDLLAEAELLAREGELRGAIRKAYVALLCELGDRRLIRLAQHKTNRDYLRAIRKSAPPQLYEEMEPLTAGFERHWYGLEEADQSDWADFRTRCRQALNFK